MSSRKALSLLSHSRESNSFCLYSSSACCLSASSFIFVGGVDRSAGERATDTVSGGDRARRRLLVDLQMRSIEKRRCLEDVGVSSFDKLSATSGTTADEASGKGAAVADGQHGNVARDVVAVWWAVVG